MSRDPTELLVAANDVVDRLGVLWRLFRGYRRVPVQLEVQILGLNRSAPPMPFEVPNDRIVRAAVTFRDQYQQPTVAPGAVTWSVSDDTLATVTPSPDGLSADVLATAGDGNFTVAVSAGNLAGVSDQIDIVPGAPVGALISLELVQQPSPAQAQQVHRGQQKTAGGAQAQPAQAQPAQAQPAQAQQPAQQPPQQPAQQPAQQQPQAQPGPGGAAPRP